MTAHIARDKLYREFDVCDYVMQSKNHRDSREEFATSSYYEYNRYTDILPYGETRVVLQKRPGDETNDHYINANYIDSALEKGDKKIIASQGPLPQTIRHFWRMVIQEDVKMIVTTCNLVEGTRRKCEKFWPDTCSKTESNFSHLIDPEITVT